MNRTPPIEVRRVLRQEVGFSCPVPNCGSPYLEWHHFDPFWHERNHHDPQGMIALCGEHHAKADAGAFTKTQLHQFKRNGANILGGIKGKFDWLRNKILLVGGNNFYFETLTLLRIGDMPIIWLRRNENGHLLLNIQMISMENDYRLYLEDNSWIERGTPIDFECPPSGKLIDAKYLNGDRIRIEFIEIFSKEQLENRYPLARVDRWNYLLSLTHPEDMFLKFPITVIELLLKVVGANLEISPSKTKMDIIQLRGSFSAYAGTVFQLGDKSARLINR